MTGPQVTAAKAADVEYEIDVEKIHPDPVQPRIHPDAELAESIRSQGILQAIRLEKIQGVDVPDIECPDCGVLYAELALEGGHYMIQDGERRFRGSIAAGRKTVLAKIVAPASEGDRLVAQVTSNTGKPLTPLEEALAYKRIMETKEISQAELAKLVGRPKSVIGDRIRLIELDPVWLDLIEREKLQVSHAPIISTFSAVPAQYQKKAAANLLEDYRAKRFLDNGDKIPVDEMRHLLYVSFRDYIKPMGDVPGYRGPQIQISGRYGNHEGRTEKYAADIALWRPIFNKRQNKRRKEMQRNAGSSPQRARDVTLSKLETLEKRQSSEYYVKAGKGEVLLYIAEEGWSSNFGGDPETFLSLTDPAKLTRVYGRYNAGIVTSDLDSVAAAKETLAKRLKQQLEPQLVEIRRFLSHASVHRVQGPGCREIVRATANEYDAPYAVVGMALGIKGFEVSYEPRHQRDRGAKVPELTLEQAEQLATAYVAVLAKSLKVPEPDDLATKAWNKVRKTPFRLPAPPYISKTRAKKMARAAGKQVGDPTRAQLADVAPTKASRAAGALFDSVAAGFREEARA